MSHELRFSYPQKKVIEKIVSDELSKWPGGFGDPGRILSAGF